MYQRHYGGGLPKVADGAVMRIDADGEVESVTLKKHCIEGSHETSVFVRCDGETVWFDGNVSLRYPITCLAILSASACRSSTSCCSHLACLPSPRGERYVTSMIKGEPRAMWTGAKVARGHHAELRSDRQQGRRLPLHALPVRPSRADRLKTGTYGEGETVDWGRKPLRLRKGLPQGLNCAATQAALSPATTSSTLRTDPYVLQLADWCDSVGLVRFRVTFKATKLARPRCNHLGEVRHMKQLEIEFEQAEITAAQVPMWSRSPSCPSRSCPPIACGRPVMATSP